jgi:hypothetical protein
MTVFSDTSCDAPALAGRAAAPWLRWPPPLRLMRFSSKWLARGVDGVIAWMLDQPLQPAPCGQSCDRLRPWPILRELEQALAGHGHHRGELVEWRWDSRLDRAEGWLWQGRQLHRFLWWRGDDRLELRVALQCTTAAPLRSLS